MNSSIFDIQSINNNEIKWEDYLYKLTPVEFNEKMYFKREDNFAPLGYGGINGSKLRQAIYLVHKYYNSGNRGMIMTGTSVKSPQLPMGSAVAMHYGLESMHVIGATKSTVAIKRDMVKMATWFGAKFDIINIAYNHNLQLRVQELIKKRTDNPFYLEYGITLDHHLHSPEEITNFHESGAYQVKNIPDDVENVIVPMGSANSVTSFFYGLGKYGHKNIKNIYLIGIGPNRIKFLIDRLKVIGSHTNLDLVNWKTNFVHNPELNLDTNGLYNVHHYDLHTTKYVNYQQEMKYQWNNIELHPTYEGKVMTYINDKLPELINEKTLFWIIGSKPRIEDMKDILIPKLGNIPDSLSLYKK